MKSTAKWLCIKERIDFQQFSEPLNCWYTVTAYSDEPGYFVTLFNDITALKREEEVLKGMNSVIEEFLAKPFKDIDYQLITDYLLVLSEGKYAVFNLYNKEGSKFTTVALSGIRKDIRKAADILGFNIHGREWDHDEVKHKKIRNRIITRFPDLSHLIGRTIPKNVSNIIMKSFKTGETLVAKIMSNNQLIRDFTIIMPAGKTFKMKAS